MCSSDLIQLFFKKLMDIQNSLKSGQRYSPNEISYLDYAFWLNDKSNFESSSNYWKAVFADYSESFDLPRDLIEGDLQPRDRKSVV